MGERLYLKENTMEKVNYYTRKLSQGFFDDYQGFFESYSDRKKIQHKIKNNLLVSIKKLMTEGYKEDEALTISLQNFEGVDKLIDERNRLYKKRKYDKWVLKAAIILAITGIILHVIAFNGEKYVIKTEADKILTIVCSNIGTSDSPVTKDMKIKLEQVFKSNKFVKAIGIKKIDNRYKSKYCYLYPNDIKIKEGEIELKDSFIFKQVPLVNPRDGQYKIPNSEEYISVQVITNIFSDNFYRIANLLLFLYWILFAIWANAGVRYKGGDKAWILLFIYLNLIGYIIYKSIECFTKERIDLEL